MMPARLVTRTTTQSEELEGAGVAYLSRLIACQFANAFVVDGRASDMI